MDGAVLGGEGEGNGQEEEKGKAGAAGVQPKKRVLMLGSGMVAPPAVQELCSRSDVQLVVGQSSLLQLVVGLGVNELTCAACSEQYFGGC